MPVCGVLRPHGMPQGASGRLQIGWAISPVIRVALVFREAWAALKPAFIVFVHACSLDHKVRSESHDPDVWAIRHYFGDCPPRVALGLSDVKNETDQILFSGCHAPRLLARSLTHLRADLPHALPPTSSMYRLRGKPHRPLGDG